MGYKDVVKKQKMIYGDNINEYQTNNFRRQFMINNSNAIQCKKSTIYNDINQLSDVYITFIDDSSSDLNNDRYRFDLEFSNKINIKRGYYLNIKEYPLFEHIDIIKNDISKSILSKKSLTLIDLYYSIFKPYIQDLNALYRSILENEDKKIKDTFYIITDIKNVHDINYSGVLKRCDYKLKWIADGNPDIIYERWVNKSIGGTIIKGNSFTEDIVYPNDKISLIVPRTELFQKTFTKDKRLMVGYNEITEVPSVYKIEGMTDLRNGNYDDGIIEITIIADLFDEFTDDKDRFIADILGYHYEYDLILNTPNVLELNVDDTIQIDVIVEKYDDSDVKQQVLNPKLTYLSSDESIVTVDENGLITAIGDGNANIIINGYKKEVQINVNVSEEIISNVYIKSSNENYSLATQQNSEMYYFTTFVDGVEQTDIYIFDVTPKNDKRFSYEVMKNNKTLKITPTDYTCDIKVILTSINYPDLTKEINLTVR